ncbi:3-oxoacyl-ACP reductase FabG [Nocardiopsis tropica]|jgi:3-oxoacyl-[acyl-carrier protein] reductase|uniref:3-oxoacyl-ACP reductase FabG n=1 Tax=Nocardiopsis tropica TaxID=109330 RepID=A0ABU7KL21_9ACTN|nr:3-oxoacyl-ACP reductase FabG [Nocardiopsis umidischolae]MEE2049995.1 3-oxoacyl-ACP reductase FabG [Nocardiopsis umidischolae]
MSRRVLVTGGNRGIGLAVARMFAAQGDEVVVTHRDGSPPDGLHGVRCDVRDPGSVEEAVERVRRDHGPVEVLVSNAGITRDGLLLGMSDAEFTEVLDTNLVGALRVTRAVLTDMVRARWGRLVYVSSLTGLVGAPGQANYAASKAGLIGLAHSVAREVGKRGITANVVSPGLVDTDMTSDLAGPRREALIGRTAVGRAGTPEEVAAAVRFLASDGAGYVTAANIPVNGGAEVG